MRDAIKIALVVLALGFVVTVYVQGRTHGINKIQAEWDAQKILDAKALKDAQDKIDDAEDKSRQESQRISDELAKVKEDAAAAVAAANVRTALRLRDSEGRAALYMRDAEAGATERANLASHAAQLDRSLSEGIGLVEELRATLELRDGQIRGLAAQITSDRQLISGQGKTDGN